MEAFIKYEDILEDKVITFPISEEDIVTTKGMYLVKDNKLFEHDYNIPCYKLAVFSEIRNLTSKEITLGIIKIGDRVERIRT